MKGRGRNRQVARPKLYARHILESTCLDEREFLSLMCNAFDRQQIMSEIHDPDFSLNKFLMNGTGS